MRRGSRNFLQGGGVKRLFDFAGGGGGLSHFFIFINKLNSARGVGGLGPGSLL